MKKINRALATAMVVASSLTLLSACTSENAYHGQQQIAATPQGMTVGAIAGAAIAGVATGGPGAVIGAAIGGGAVGGAVGYSMDKDEDAMRAKLRNAGVSVIEVGYSNQLLLLMPSDIRFATGSSELSPQFKTSLDAVAQVMKEYPYTVAELPGNTDSVGSYNYNMQLSMARSQAVADYMATQGIPANRLVTEGFSKMRPIASNKTVRGRAMNRRVQIILFAPAIPLRNHDMPAKQQ